MPITNENYHTFTHEELFNEIKALRSEPGAKLEPLKKLVDEQKATIEELVNSRKALAAELHATQGKLQDRQARLNAFNEAIEEAGVSHLVGKIILKLIAQK